MSELWMYFNIGLKHVININAYDHVLFLIALSIPYSFKDWKRLFILVSLFTVGHTLALLLSAFDLIKVNVNLVEFVIPITILIVAFFNLFTSGKSNKNESISFIALVTITFGIIHGFGFSSYFNSILPGSGVKKLLPVSEFALGIEAAQVIVIFVMLIISYIVQTFFRFSKRDWTLVMSAFIIGVVIPMILKNPIWNRG
jgi:hypothetical protein